MVKRKAEKIKFKKFYSKDDKSGDKLIEVYDLVLAELGIEKL